MLHQTSHMDQQIIYPTEDHPLNGVHPYEISKSVGDNLLHHL